MPRVSPGFRIKKGTSTSYSTKLPSVPKSAMAPKTQKKEFIKSSKEVLIKRTFSKSPSFPGVIKNSGMYSQNTPGLFVSTIKGMKGKHFIEKGLDRGLQMYLSAE